MGLLLNNNIFINKLKTVNSSAEYQVLTDSWYKVFQPVNNYKAKPTVRTFTKGII